MPTSSHQQLAMRANMATILQAMFMEAATVAMGATAARPATVAKAATVAKVPMGQTTSIVANIAATTTTCHRNTTKASAHRDLPQIQDQ